MTIHERISKAIVHAAEIVRSEKSASYAIGEFVTRLRRGLRDISDPIAELAGKGLLNTSIWIEPGVVSKRVFFVDVRSGDFILSAADQVEIVRNAEEMLGIGGTLVGLARVLKDMEELNRQADGLMGEFRNLVKECV
jgi:hypothetical protein